jgi:molybdate transport repressor ModE-like protein
MKAACKIWIDQDGKVFGDGPYELLKGVEKTGSLHKVADEMRMAYSKAWTLIRLLEQRLGFPLENTGGERADGALKDRWAKDEVQQSRAEMKGKKSRMPQRRSR